jgi:hypothetical protein
MGEEQATGHTLRATPPFPRYFMPEPEFDETSGFRRRHHPIVRTPASESSGRPSKLLQERLSLVGETGVEKVDFDSGEDESGTRSRRAAGEARARA